MQSASIFGGQLSRVGELRSPITPPYGCVASSVALVDPLYHFTKSKAETKKDKEGVLSRQALASLRPLGNVVLPTIAR